MTSFVDPTRHAPLLSALRRHGAMSRQELSQLLGIRPNTVGDAAELLLERRLVQEGASRVQGRGRPSVPLELDPHHRHVAGLALEPGRARLTLLNLLGQRLGPTLDRGASRQGVVDTAAKLLAGHASDALLGVAVSITGLVDRKQNMLLFSSVSPDARTVSLQPLLEAARDRPVRVEHDLHALAGQWRMGHPEPSTADEDVLLVYLNDQAVGAATLLGGRTNPGSVIGGSELGHTRMPVDTPRCFCGQTGCLEQVFSSGYLRRRRGRGDTTLAQAAAVFTPDDVHLDHIIRLTATGIVNAVHLLRPHRLVLACPYLVYPPFTQRLVEIIRDTALPVLSERLQIEPWLTDDIDFAFAAAHVALGEVFEPSSPNRS